MAEYVSNEADICNMALDHLNEGPIDSIEDSPTDKIPALCARWYHQTRRSALRSHTWNFAMKRVKLAALSEAPAFEFTTQYALPSDYLRIVQIGENDEYTRYYGVENGNLLINAQSSSSSLPIRYVCDFKNVQDMDPLFIEYFAALLAVKLAYPITGSNAATDRVMKVLAGVREEAMIVDGQERPPTRIERSRFRQARRSPTSTYNSIYLKEN